MDPIIIDTLHMASSDGKYPALDQFMKRDRAKELTSLDTLLDSLHMEKDVQEKIQAAAWGIAKAWETRGFRDGFRLAARLWQECGAATDPPQPRPGT